MLHMITFNTSVLNYLNALVWDGVPRLSRWLVDYAGAPDEPRTHAVSRVMLIAAVRRARQPGCRFDTLVVLVGPGGCGKSSALRVLAGEENWWPAATLVQPELPPHGAWLVETSGLAHMDQEALTALKAFLSQSHGITHLPYQREVVSLPRKFVVVGTSNDPNFLQDTTAHRRFWPVTVQHFDLDRLRTDRDQLWAEAAAAESLGESIRLDGSHVPLETRLQRARTGSRKSFEDTECAERAVDKALVTEQKIAEGWSISDIDLDREVPR